MKNGFLFIASTNAAGIPLTLPDKPLNCSCEDNTHETLPRPLTWLAKLCVLSSGGGGCREVTLLGGE